MPDLATYDPYAVAPTAPPQQQAPPPPEGGGGVDLATYDPYAAPPPQEQSPPPQEAPPPSQPDYMVPQGPQPEPQAAPPEKPVITGNSPGDLLGRFAMGVEDALGTNVGPHVPDGLKGLGFPVSETIAAPGNIKDKLLAAGDYWNRPYEQGIEQRGKEALKIAAGQSPEILPQEVKADPKLTLNTVGQAFTQVLGMNPLNDASEPGFYEWAEQNKDRLGQYADDPAQIYELWKQETGRTFDAGFWGGLRGLGYDALNDPTLPAQVIVDLLSGGAAVGAGAGLKAAGLSERTALNVARGIKVGQKIVDAGIDPTDPLLGAAGRGVKKIFQPSEETRRQVMAQAKTEIAQGVADERAMAGARSYPTLNTTPPPAAPPVPQALPPGGTTPGPLLRPRNVVPGGPGNQFLQPQGNLAPAGARNTGPFATPMGPGRMLTPNPSTPIPMPQGTLLRPRPSTATPNGGTATPNGRPVASPSANGAPPIIRPRQGTSPASGAPLGGKRTKLDAAPASGANPGEATRPHATKMGLRRDPTLGIVKTDGAILAESDLADIAKAFRPSGGITPEMLDAIDLKFEHGATLTPAEQQIVMMRQALFQNRADTGRPFWVDDWHKRRAEDIKLTTDPAQKSEKIARYRGAQKPDRYLDVVIDRINTYGEREVIYRMRQIERARARDLKVPNLSPEVRNARYDNMRKTLKEAIDKSTYRERGVDLGVTTKSRGAQEPIGTVHRNGTSGQDNLNINTYAVSHDVMGRLVPGRTTNDTEAVRLGLTMDVYPNVPHDLQQRLRRQLDDLGLSDIALHITDRILDPLGGELFGEYIPSAKLIQVAVQVDDVLLKENPLEAIRNTLDHEAIHAMRDLDLITKSEWETLVSASKRLRKPEGTGARGSFIDDAHDIYGFWSRRAKQGDPQGIARIEEEAVAELFSLWRMGTRSIDPKAASIIEKIFTFMKRMVDALRGTDAEDVLTRIASGEIGSRNILSNEKLGLPDLRTSTDYEKWIARDAELGEGISSGRLKPIETVPLEDDLRMYRRVRSATGPTVQDPLTKYDGLHIPNKAWEAVLDLDVKGKSFFRHITDSQDDIYRLRDLAARGTRSTAEDAEFTKLAKTYGAAHKELYGVEADWTTLPDSGANKLAADYATKQWFDALPPLQKKAARSGPLRKILGTVRDFGDFRSGTGLYNWAAAPRQTVVQYFGNTLNLVLTKPSALVGMLNPVTFKQYYQAAKEARSGIPSNRWRVYSSGMRQMHAMGVPTNLMINDRAKSAAGFGAYEPRSDFGKGLKKIIAPDFLRDFVAIPDMMHRDAVANATFFPEMRKHQAQFGSRAGAMAQDWNRSRNLGVDAAGVKKAIDDAFAAKKGDFRVSSATSHDIEDAIYARYAGQAGVDSTQLRNFANRVGRDYQSVLNDASQNAAREVRRIAFSFDSTRLDDALRHALIYHYWSSRAGRLYATELAKNPWMAANFFRLSQAANEEAQNLEYPAWMQGFLRLASSPAGSVLWARPLDLFATMLTFADWQYGMEPEKAGSDLTMIGRARGVIPALINPIVDSFIWGLGGYGGRDAQVPYDPMGFEKIPRFAAQLINTANLNGMLPAGMLRDAAGNPQLLAERPMTDLVAKFSSALLGVVRDNPQPIPNLFASQQSGIATFLIQGLAEDHPDWTEDMVTREAVRMLDEVDDGKTASPELLDAERRYLEMQIRGPEFAGGPAEGLIGGILRNISPMATLARPEIVPALKDYGAPGRPVMDLPDMQDQYDAMDMQDAMYNTRRARDLSVANEDWFGDPALRGASQTYYAIGMGEADGITVDGYTYANDEIRALNDQPRWKLARLYLAEQGYTPQDLELAKQQQGMLEEGNPDLAGFKGWQDYLDNYPGGANAAVDETYRTSPSFRAYMDQTPYPKGTDEWYRAAHNWTDAYIALTGERESHYSPLNPPAAGHPAGLTDTSQLVTQRAEDRAAKAESANSFIADRERSVNELYYAQKLLDQTYPGYGLRVGSGKLPYEVWTTMKDVWEGAGINTKYITSPDHYGAQYVAWRQANPDATDTSIQAWVDATATDNGKNSLLETEDGTALPESIDLSQPPPPDDFETLFNVKPNAKDQTRLARPTQELPLRSSPSGSAQMLTVLPPKLAIRIIEVQGSWAHVTAPGGFSGWVDASALQVA